MAARWSRPHWAMTYKVRAPQSMAQTASPRISHKERRPPWLLRRSGTPSTAFLDPIILTYPSVTFLFELTQALSVSAGAVHFLRFPQ